MRLFFFGANQTGFAVPTTDNGSLEPTPTPVRVTTPSISDEIALAAAAAFILVGDALVGDAGVCRCCSCGDTLGSKTKVSSSQGEAGVDQP